MPGGHRSPTTPQRSAAGMDHGAERRRGDAGVGQDARGYGGGGGGQGLETERETKNNWQQGLDEFTRRWGGGITR